MKKNKFISFIKKSWLLSLIILLAFVFRLFRLNHPLLDWHSFRQADTASVTREFVKHNYPLWQPHYHDLGSIQSGAANLEGYRFVEFPLINYLLAIPLKAFPRWDLVIFSRLMTALASSLSVLLLYFILQKWQKNKTLSLLATAFFAFLPFAIYYGRAILPEPWQILFCLMTILSFTYYLEKKNFTFWLLSLFSFSLALLLKPTSVFIFPLLMLLAGQKYDWQFLKKGELYLLVFISFLPLLWWRNYMQQFPTGIPASDWLFNSDQIRLRPAWWRWLFYERLTKTWLGYFGLLFFLAGLIPEKWLLFKKNVRLRLSSFDWQTYVLMASFFLYLVIFATGNVRHDYYQVILLPVIALVYARGLVYIFTWWRDKLNLRLALVLLLLINMVSLYFAWNQNLGKFNVNNWAAFKLGKVADQILPAQALVIADSFDADTNFLFQTNRTGWSEANKWEEKLVQGAEFYLTTNFDDRFHQLVKTYPLFYQDENGAILDLRGGQKL